MWTRGQLVLLDGLGCGSSARTLICVASVDSVRSELGVSYNNLILEYIHLCRFIKDFNIEMHDTINISLSVL